MSKLYKGCEHKSPKIEPSKLLIEKYIHDKRQGRISADFSRISAISSDALPVSFN